MKAENTENTGVSMAGTKAHLIPKQCENQIFLQNNLKTTMLSLDNLIMMGFELQRKHIALTSKNKHKLTKGILFQFTNNNAKVHSTV